MLRHAGHSHVDPGGVCCTLPVGPSMANVQKQVTELSPWRQRMRLELLRKEVFSDSKQVALDLPRAIC